MLECAIEGRLSCADAHFIAEEADVPLEAVGRVCNREEPRIKITACRLGCF